MASEKNDNFIPPREARRIARENRREMTQLERRKKRKRADEASYAAEMKDPKNVVEIEDLRVNFYTDAGVVKAVNGATLNIPEASILGIVGESGCGKSVISLSLLQLVQAPQGQIAGGSIRFRTKENKVYDIAKMPRAAMYKIRGCEISMIFQEPMTSLNPVFSIGSQLDEVALIHTPGATRETARRQTLNMLKLVGIPAPEKACAQYPHELSGGMRQRVMIAMALTCRPKLLIADEPTTALDVTIQAQILDLLRGIRNEIGCGVMFITHDLGVIAEIADYVVVMYAGKIVEQGTTAEIFETALHPYTIGLQRSVLSANKTAGRLYNIPGRVPNPIRMPGFCYFRDRCRAARGQCEDGIPVLKQVTDTHGVACFLYGSEPERPLPSGADK
ncbi:MAG: ATP-binding cassette domain-containing protein [Clostridiales bacterium]|jgi:peptide/nickel transport system ATP-binding protein|nr:ATP-binding cassette domain-containing protein [Clostridiales bacterium]